MLSGHDDIWITGVGAATPLGHSFAEIAEGLLAGRSGIERVSRFAVGEHPSQIAGLVADVPCPAGHERRDFDRLAPLDRLALWCAASALADAGCRPERSDRRIGLILGTAAEWLNLWEVDRCRGGRRIFEINADMEPAAASLRQRLHLSGPAIGISAACASGNIALALARRWLQMGWVDLCLAGACDMAVTPLCLAGFGNLRALSRRNDEPARASRPFDVDRDGFVMSEGGAMFVLERAEDARARTARAYGCLAGCGITSDAHNMVIPSPDPAPAVQAMEQALADAGLNPVDVDYVNAHATSTPVGDAAEVRALKVVFQEQLPHLPVSSTKSMTGHLLTAAAAVEALACLAALQHRAVPPTINLDNPDPACNLCHVPHVAQERQVKAALSNSFGFGGSNTSIVLTAA
ncbi:MAG: beta-ketoacyl-[acyl-carrier-protein] synthase family protein [Planctomycetes bacterium]|nr:beta-ketoacyl-[acyl-carrier-protein] synthase family protein [Planctomycetota bacterium]